MNLFFFGFLGFLLFFEAGFALLGCAPGRLLASVSESSCIMSLSTEEDAPTSKSGCVFKGWSAGVVACVLVGMMAV